VSHRYRDPIDEIWLAAARRIGFRVGRTALAYAATRGDGEIAIGTGELLDADDGLGQMILHELCHALVEGEAAWSLPDWGLDNTSAKDEPREHACLRLQAALLAPRGLRGVLAPTTDYRPFYDALPADPLAGAGADQRLARIGLGRAAKKPFAPALDEALAATEAVARAAAPFAEASSLWARVEPRPDLHPLGFQLRSGAPGATCGDCAWRHHARGADRCRQAGKRVEAGWAACDRFEPDLDCQACGACCREAYDSVTVPARDPVVRLHPELIVRREGYLEIRRDGDRCAALAVEGEHYSCRVYDARPRPCRDFERAGAHCISARRRVGLTR
jgi:hypothetical protein